MQTVDIENTVVDKTKAKTLKNNIWSLKEMCWQNKRHLVWERHENIWCVMTSQSYNVVK